MLWPAAPVTDTMQAAWPPELESACYEEAYGWSRPLRQPNGKIHREPIPSDVIRAAGLDERPDLPDDTLLLVLRSEVPQNLLPRHGEAV